VASGRGRVIAAHRSGGNRGCRHARLTRSRSRVFAGFAVASTLIMRQSATHNKEKTNMVIKILPNDKGAPTGKLADAEVHFTEGAFDGLRLLGFAVWEKRGGGVGRNVTFPSRTYSVNGERRNFALLRSINGETNAQNAMRDLVLQAYAEFESQAAVAS
jgi:hypothetical protein